MAEIRNLRSDPIDFPSLKLKEPEASSDDTWNDDALDRERIAQRLTNLVRTQAAPFVVSIDGYWGTGKTFMLERWQRDLKRQNFQAIYFNAWEDDFCDDPLLAIIGQLSNYFKVGRYAEIADKIYRSTNSLIRRGSVSVSLGVVSASIPLDNKQDGRDLLQEYLDQRKTKDTLKAHLRELSAKILQETSHPMVFIIDELDRCRPTFAIELLERVKHIFDVPGLVFVFGVNRDELCKSLNSIYGEIKADVYLRRFFDMEFTLPEVDSQLFCEHLFEKFNFEEFFLNKSVEADTDQHFEDFEQFQSRIPELWSKFGLSLRDVDYCCRLLSLACRDLRPRSVMYPWLLGLLIALKFNNQSLYRRVIRGDCLASEVMDHVHSLIPEDSGYTKMARTLALMEGFLYVVEERGLDNRRVAGPSSQFLALLNEKITLEQLPRPENLSQRVKDAFEKKERGIFDRNSINIHSDSPQGRMIASLLETIRLAQNNNLSGDSLRHLVATIDLHQDMVRR